jgi:hypothetical protein
VHPKKIRKPISSFVYKLHYLPTQPKNKNQNVQSLEG